MATYNGSRHLREQLDSLAAQTRRPDELVICDDNSSDATIAIAERFASEVPFPVQISCNSSNLGFNGNFERSLSLTSGRVVFICDQDDIWSPEKLERVMAVVEAQPLAPAVVNDEYIADAEAKPVGVTFLENVRKVGYPDGYHVAGCCTALRREVLPLLLPFPPDINYDVWIAALLDRLHPRYILDVPLQYYRRHGTNTTESIAARRSASFLGMVLEFGLSDPRQGWRDQSRTWQLCAERIEQRREEAAAFFGPERVEAALASLRVDIASLEQRLDLLSRSRLRRAPRLIDLWRSGFYRAFAGGKSAIKDLVRP
jgi:glycosyltransferase involved in cell wall biosynthesis